MPDFTIDIEKDMSANPSVLFVKNHEGRTIFHSHPSTLRKIIFWVGDVVAPGWCEDDDNREKYLKYADNAKNGQIELYDENFLEIAWPKVLEHLKIDGVSIYSLDRKDS